MKRSHRVYDVVKRVLDVIASAVLLVLLSPLLLALALLVRVNVGSPILFNQKRPGRNGRLFTIRKLRTMKPVASVEGDVEAVSTDAERLTPFGRFMRSTSLDELPEFWNVLVGDMSIVGPRPLLTEYLDRYTPEQARRHEVRPGITGWAQVNGRNAIDWPERFALDVWYVDHRSLLLDARIVGMTIGTALKRTGISSSGHATMEPFDPDQPARPSEEEP